MKNSGGQDACPRQLRATRGDVSPRPVIYSRTETFERQVTNRTYMKKLDTQKGRDYSNQEVRGALGESNGGPMENPDLDGGDHGRKDG